MAAIERELPRLERQYWQAMKDKDLDTIERLTADPCTVTGAQGAATLDKQQLLEMMQAAPYSLDAFEVKNVNVRPITDDVAMLSYQVHEDMTVDGKPVSLDAADASVWVRRNGRWVCALHTESITGDPFGRDRRPS